MTTVTLCGAREEWDEMVLEFGGHPLQLWGWGELKAAHNWQVERYVVNEDKATIGLAQVLIRQLPRPFGALLYIPRGPVMQAGREEEVLNALVGYLKQHHHAVGLQIEPDLDMLTTPKGWRLSKNTILISRTLILDLKSSEDELLAAMSKKTRQYIRKSTKEPLAIKRVTARDEIEKCLVIYKQTADRAGFRLHDDQYYYDVHDKLGESSVIFASYEGDAPVAFLWLTVSGRTAFELYGGVNDEGQRLRANYALKWHAITKTKEWGIERYDMNGLLNDGVSTFKQGFAAHETMLAGTYDHPLSPLYFVWTKLLPLAKKVFRAIKHK